MAPSTILKKGTLISLVLSCYAVISAKPR